VDHIALVRSVEPIRDLQRDLNGLFPGQSSPHNAIGERRTVDQLENERDTIRVFNAINRADVRMIQRSEELRLTSKPSETLGISGNRFWEHFDGDVALKLRVTRAVDFAHTAATERSKDLVGAEAGAGDER